uniref:Uncharacterized protein n=1 Tax=Anguilla anguilla TaxID=7936 RepID=A0A0E9X2S6_ANGAN
MQPHWTPPLGGPSVLIWPCSFIGQFARSPTMGAAGTTPTSLPRAMHSHRVTAPPPASLSARGCGLFLQEQRRRKWCPSEMSCAPSSS